MSDERALATWFRRRFPRLHLTNLLSQYNRMPIPIQEDLEVLRQLKIVLDGVGADDFQAPVHAFMMSLAERARALEEACDDVPLDLPSHRIRGGGFDDDGQSLEDNKPPPEVEGIWRSLVRQRSMIAINETVLELVPSLIQELRSKTATIADNEALSSLTSSTTTKTGSEPASPGMAEKLQPDLTTRKQKGRAAAPPRSHPSKKKHLQNGRSTDTRVGKAGTVTRMLRRSPRTQKA
jgi:hypothetical protein